VAGIDTRQRNDTYLGSQFVVVIGGDRVAGFSEVSGLDFETNVETFREGGLLLYEQQLAGPAKFPSRIVLKRGVAENTTLWDWHQNIVNGLVVRKDIEIQLLDQQGVKKRHWNFSEAAPVKWVGPQFRAAASEIAIESLELVHRGYVKT